MKFQCIYCKKTFPEVKKSKSHILPIALGKGPVLGNAVCKNCNDKFNMDVEGPIIRATASLRNLLAIEGRKGRRDYPSLEAKAKFKNAEIFCKLRHPNELNSRLFFFSRIVGEKEKKKLYIIGDKKRVEEKQREYNAKHPETKWEPISRKDIGKGIGLEFELDLRCLYKEEGMRLACKMAFELYTKNKTPEFVIGCEFDEVRKYIIDGEKPYRICKLVTSPRILMGLGNIPFGIHSMYLDNNMNSRKVIAIVGIFSLVFYKIILTKFAPVYANSQELLIINPQVGEHKPIILGPGNVKSPNLHIEDIYDRMSHQEAIEYLHKEILNRLNNGLKTIYEQNGF